METCENCLGILVWHQIAVEGQTSAFNSWNVIFELSTSLKPCSTCPMFAKLSPPGDNATDVRPLQVCRRAKFTLVKYRKLGRSRTAQSSPFELEDNLSANELLGFECFDFCLVIVDEKDFATERMTWWSTFRTLEQTTYVISDWLRECQGRKGHEECNLEAGFLPKRLLKLDEAVKEDHVKLIDTDELNISDLRYTTLSHCWGPPTSQPPIRTTKITELSHRQGILLKTLPNTFQEAVAVTLALGIQYLWIDSLCIIQDDLEDWQEEAARMSSIYQGSFITIAATGSSDSQGGLMAPPKPMLCVNVPDTNHETNELIESHNSKSLVLDLMEHKNYIWKHKTALWESPLSKRGWVLQELVLSPRTVHFAYDQLYWQCRGTFTNESSFVPWENFESLKHYSDIQNPKFRLGQKAFYPDDHFWWQWIVDYSTRSFTFPRDRIAAIAGITDYHHQITGKSPILGLWAESLYYDLGWSPAPPCEQKSPLRRIDGESQGISPPRSINVVDWEVKWSNQPFTSSLLETRLVVSGYFRPVPKSTFEGFLEFISRVADVFLPDPSIEFDEDETIILLLLYVKKEWDGVVQENFLAISSVSNRQKLGQYRRLGIGTVERSLVPDIFDVKSRSYEQTVTKSLFYNAERATFSLI
ncbi:uncharacterized protein PAC_19976 [Phialocephala subalpina]|uniref:Heterokaryon incompatibility domain-containing protein n=1 Tax=Phialocephala subalpina TaxID=576137 RepID=A0A1L7XYQ4_9HELO|nr:uncharacterized protein PAC_19976 [Phialocephala subalpina]